MILQCAYRVAARATVARWLLLVLQSAGASDTAGSTRAAAATWAAARGVTMDTIMQAADWTIVPALCVRITYVCFQEKHFELLLKTLLLTNCFIFTQIIKQWSEVYILFSHLQEME